jgi:hypothetical protein
VAFHGQTASLVVGQANPLGTVRRPEDPVLLAQVVNDGLLLSIDPAREDQEEERERRRQRIHGWKLDSRARRFQGVVAVRNEEVQTAEGFQTTSMRRHSGVGLRPGFRTPRGRGRRRMRPA